MSRRIDIELTSARPDGSWTWRAAGAREPKGVVDSAVLPSGAKVGGVYKADAEFELDGITVLSVTDPKQRSARDGLLQILPSDKPFEAVTQQLAKRGRGERSDRGDRGERRDRRDRPSRDGDARRDGGRESRDGRGTGERRGDPRRGAADGGERRREFGGQRSGRPSFNAPPELPQRPKAKRLKPGRQHRNAVLAELDEAQRPVAERALQGGIPAVRAAIKEQNAQLKAEGKETVPDAGLISMAEHLLPRLRVAEWLDRADAAKRDLDDLDLRDLRSVVAGADDPMVARDEATRELAGQLKEALAVKQESELNLWFGDIDAAIGVGRIVRALKLSSQPPKAGIRFPTELATKLTEATNASLEAEALPDRWVAVLEAAAFAPIRAAVVATAPPRQVNDELTATVKRLGPLLPQVAGVFGIEVAAGASAPKPLRPTRPANARPRKQAPPPPPAADAAE